MSVVSATPAAIADLRASTIKQVQDLDQSLLDITTQVQDTQNSCTTISRHVNFMSCAVTALVILMRDTGNLLIWYILALCSYDLRVLFICSPMPQVNKLLERGASGR